MTTKKVRNPESGEVTVHEVPENLRRAADEAMATIAIASLEEELEDVDMRDLLCMSPDVAVKRLATLRNKRLMQLIAVGTPPKMAQEHADLMWREAMPNLDDIRSVRMFLALVAWGLRTRILDGNEAKLLVFMAQTHLSLLKLNRAEEQSEPGQAAIAALSGDGLFPAQEMRRAVGWIDPEKGGKNAH